MMSVNERDDLVGRVVERNYAKCIERGATPYRVVDEGRGVEVYDALDGSWRLLHAFDSKAARERWERAKATREAYVPANGLAHLGGKPFSARVVRLEQDRSMKHSGMITVKETPSWRHVSSIQMADAAAAIRAMADDDATIIDTDGESLRRLLRETAAPAAGDRDACREPGTADADDERRFFTNTHEEPMKQQTEKRSTPNAQRATSNDGSAALIAVDDLTEHPKALAFWPEGKSREDAAALLAESVARDGIRHALTVCRRPEGGWWVIDGCTRLAAARAAGLAEVPCRDILASEETIDDEIYIANLVRTSASCGMRIMRYLERHHDQVLAAAIVNADPAKSGALGGRGNKGVNSVAPFSSGAIAERLKVGKQDVSAAIELLRCRAEGRIVDAADGTRKLRPATDEEREGVEEAYRRVLDGTPPRRWLPAARGHAATNDKAKADTNWYEVGRRAFVSVQNAFAHLDDMDSGRRAKVIAAWSETAKVVSRHISNLGTGV